MKRTFALLAAVTLGTVIFAGCEQITPGMPDVPKLVNGEPAKVLAVVDDTEKQLVSAASNTYCTFENRLQVLMAYYERIGNLDKQRWATLELNNLRQTNTVTWEGAPHFIPPSGESLVDASEHMLVEDVIAARNAWKKALGELRDFYDKRNYGTKEEVVRNMQDRFDPVRSYMYFVEAEMPPKDLRPSELNSEAERLFDEGVTMFKEGKGLLHWAATTNYQKERLALVTFKNLITRYPQSTKIALAAYYIADIYKEYFQEHMLAVAWYERAWTWDPHVTEPAHFQAATVYDFHLHNYAKALECYREALKSDPWRLYNPEYAQKRINELTGKQ